MLIINIVFFLLLLGYGIFSAIKPREWMAGIDKKEHKLYFLYPAANEFMVRTGLYRRLQRNRSVPENMKALYITNKPELHQRLYWCSKISMTYLLLGLLCVISLFLQLEEEGNSILQQGRYLTRPEFGEGSFDAKLSVELNEAANKQGLSENISITVEERLYTTEEIVSLFQSAEEYLHTAVLGSNPSPYNIHEKLNFLVSIPGTRITVEWKPEDYSVIHSDGTLGNATLVESVSTHVTAILTCQDQKKEVYLSFVILPIREKEEESLTQKLRQEIDQNAAATADQKQLELPSRLSNYGLSWHQRNKNVSTKILLYGIIVVVLVWILQERELQKKMKLRKEQLLFDYPEIINKFTLLVNAGMTMRQAWFKMVEDYTVRKSEASGSKKSCIRYAYEEMKATANELKLGVAETAAYEQYGRRVGLLPYIKFSSLITQNMKKGNKGFTELLKQEAAQAFEERKETAKRLGEEAGTKLLMPMMLLLLMVFMIILIPAFISFRI